MKLTSCCRPVICLDRMLSALHTSPPSQIIGAVVCTPAGPVGSTFACGIGLGAGEPIGAGTHSQYSVQIAVFSHDSLLSKLAGLQIWVPGMKSAGPNSGNAGGVTSQVFANS